MDIDERAAERILADVLTAAKGDAHTGLALLQGMYIELALRTVQERPSIVWPATMAAFCQVAMNKLKDSSISYSGARSLSEASRDGFADAAGEGRRFAEFLYHRMQASTLTTPRAFDPDVEGCEVETLA
ncbi:hypothetical protein BH11MYX1_BH11MYX1_30310 [soil metagenome]